MESIFMEQNIRVQTSIFITAFPDFKIFSFVLLIHILFWGSFGALDGRGRSCCSGRASYWSGEEL